MKTKDTDVCLRLGEERKRLYLNQNKVAAYCEVSVKTIGRWEKNIPIPSDKLALLVKLGYDITYILTGVKLSPQVAGLDAASQAWKIKSDNETVQDAANSNITKDQETWLSILEDLADGDSERLKLIGLALVGYSQAKSDK